MCLGWKWNLVMFVSFVLSGKTLDAQVDDLSCGPFCLNGQTTCECTVTGDFLKWEIDIPHGENGEKSLQPEDLNKCTPLTGLPTFCARLMDSSNGTLTATLRFNITNRDYQDSLIDCSTGNNNSTTLTINIEGAPGEIENLTMLNVTSTSVWFAFDPPKNSGCIAYYKIVTDANGTIDTPDSLVLITKPQSDNSSNTTYMITVSAVDTAGTEGPLYKMCFMFAMEDAQSCPINRPPPTGTVATPPETSPSPVNEELDNIALVVGVVVPVIVIILLVIVVIVIIAIVYTKKKARKDDSDGQLALVERKTDSTTGENGDPVYVSPEQISHEQAPTGDLYTAIVDKPRRTPPSSSQADTNNTYQDPGTIQREQPRTGDQYAVVNKSDSKPVYSEVNKPHQPDQVYADLDLEKGGQSGARHKPTPSEEKGVHSENPYSKVSSPTGQEGVVDVPLEEYL